MYTRSSSENKKINSWGWCEQKDQPPVEIPMSGQSCPREVSPPNHGKFHPKNPREVSPPTPLVVFPISFSSSSRPRTYGLSRFGSEVCFGAS